MSWQAYVDTNLVGSARVSKAAILGLKGGIWASSPGFTLSTEEQAAIVAAFSPAGADAIQSNGIRLAGQKYFTVSVVDRTIQGKRGADGVVIVKTKQSVLVAEYVAPIQAPEATTVVESLADYLISLEY